MSRSYKKTPVIANTSASSEKSDKKHAHKVYRKRIKNDTTSLHSDVDKLEELIMPIEKELSNTCTMSKDGKRYVNIDEHIDDDRIYNSIKKCLRK